MGGFPDGVSWLDDNQSCLAITVSRVPRYFEDLKSEAEPWASLVGIWEATITTRRATRRTGRPVKRRGVGGWWWYGSLQDGTLSGALSKRNVGVLAISRAVEGSRGEEKIVEGAAVR